MSATDLSERVRALVARIPRGRVATYGQLAQMAGRPRAARQVGQVLRALDESKRLPWHRVVNSSGRVSRAASRGGGDRLQELRLRAEGVAVDESGRLDLERHLWRPRS